jgi:hypothetical protein
MPTRKPASSPSPGKWVIMRDGKVYSSYRSEVLARKQYHSLCRSMAAGQAVKLIRPDGTED